MPTFTTAIFDLDGTIADTLPLIYDAFDAALRPIVGRRLDDAEVRALFGPPDNDIIRSMVPPEAFDMAFARYVEVYERDHDTLVQAFDGLPDIVAEAAKEGMRLGVVTGKSRQTALYSLARLGLRDAFSVVYAGDDVARQKPDPEAVIAILNDLGHGANDTGAFVGDSAADVLAGHAAGLTTIGVTWGNPDHAELLASNPDIVVDTMPELARALGLSSPTTR